MTDKPPSGWKRFYAQRGHFTYDNILVNKEEYKTWASEHLKVDRENIHIAHEKAPTTGMLHSHVLIMWNKAFQTRDESKFDYEGIHPNIKPVNSREYLMNVINYLAKEDPECEYLRTMKMTAFCKHVWTAKTLTEALEQVERPSDVLGTIAMFKNKPQEEIKKETLDNPRPWQKIILNIVDSEPDDRSIYWVYDRTGGAGKSRLCRYLEDNGKAIVLTGLGNARDVAQILRGRIEQGQSTRCIIGDLSRSYQDRDIYNVLEMLKNGRMDSYKYESISLRWNAGHVIVMANFMPELTAMTEDRWRIIEVD